ncbi:helix-turn-helix domain-containing protein [Oceanispirochaeta crateris]|uniref:Helix-turn-helix domain-containing protein n=1 Tax=Oceanispirochaeta crateris TaxID=2518645 RepID=A0A5C1QLI9_9SPIO|nr:helix-turn-helix domain-containing protein [Oceanispirochaeta crateris]QEN08079.1 helix-turn-helix domain-containing protein [Oceanispirochaeta crateris]
MINIILVEDEEYLLKELALTTPWQELGCTLLGEARNGLEGLSMIEKIRPHLVITDIRMPGMDGLTMLREAERILGNKAPWAIILTGHSDFEYARQAVRLGVKDYLLKPIDDEEFHSLLSTIAKKIETSLQKQKRRKKLEMMKESRLALFQEYGSPVNGDGKDEYIRQSVAYIRKNYHRDISLMDTAENLGITRGYLSRLFKEKTGYTFLEYLTFYRLRKALKLLQKSSLKISEIAHQTGFPDDGYFIQLFRRQIGVTPGQYRSGKFKEP